MAGTNPPHPSEDEEDDGYRRLRGLLSAATSVVSETDDDTFELFSGTIPLVGAPAHEEEKEEKEKEHRRPEQGGFKRPDPMSMFDEDVSGEEPEGEDGEREAEIDSDGLVDLEPPVETDPPMPDEKSDDPPGVVLEEDIEEGIAAEQEDPIEIDDGEVESTDDSQADEDEGVSIDDAEGDEQLAEPSSSDEELRRDPDTHGGESDEDAEDDDAGPQWRRIRTPSVVLLRVISLLGYFGFFYTVSWLWQPEIMQIHSLYPEMNWGLSVKQIRILLSFTVVLGFSLWYLLAAFTYWSSKGYKEKSMIEKAIEANTTMLKRTDAKLKAGEGAIERLHIKLTSEIKTGLREDSATVHSRLQTVDASLEWAREAAKLAGKEDREITSILSSLERIRKEMPTLKVSEITDEQLDECSLATAGPREVATLVGLARMWRIRESLKFVSNIPHEISPKEQEIMDAINSLTTFRQLIEHLNVQYENILSQLSEHTLKNLVKRGSWVASF